jgi:transposase
VSRPQPADLVEITSLPAIPAQIRDPLLRRFRNGTLVGLSDTLSHGTRPGERKARLLLEVLHDREDDVLRFAHDLQVPPTSNQAERDLRPSKIQQKISGRLTSEERTRDRYTILGYVSTAAKHGIDKITALRDALTGRPWMPALPAPT